MSRRVWVFAVLISGMTLAGEIKLKNGQVIPIQGHYEVKGDQVFFTDSKGNYLQLPRAVVDLDYKPGTGAEKREPPKVPAKVEPGGKVEPDSGTETSIVLNTKSLGAYSEENKGNPNEGVSGQLAPTETFHDPSSRRGIGKVAEKELKEQEERNEYWKYRTSYLRSRIKSVEADLERLRSRDLLSRSTDVFEADKKRRRRLERELKDLKQQLLEVRGKARRDGAKARKN